MSKTPRRPNYDRKLSRRIVLADGRVLVTLQDAADLIAQEFSTVMAWGALETAIERSLAATSGTHVDIEAATRSTRTDAARATAALAELHHCLWCLAACDSRYRAAARSDAAGVTVRYRARTNSRNADERLPTLPRS